ncbi:MAG: PDZ domain-containing protein [Betaproteobacteria bacterium]|nr:PDZ domain-containing protein [Betaproteobacteria bacterium]
MMMRRCLLRVGAVLCVLLMPAIAQALQPGTYRCASYNVSGGGGSCRNFQPLVLHPDGAYQYSSTRGQWRVQGGRLVLSESTLWGPGEIIGQDTLRFEYDYRGWHHVVTWVCQECGAAGAGGGTDFPRASGAPQRGSYAGVTLTLEFDTAVGGVSGFVIVPAEAAGRYTHNAPLPEGAVQGLAWETGANAVRLATSRNNKLMGGRRYVVFLSWPRETLPVAVLDLPPTDRDYTATLPARLNIPVNAPPASQPRSRSETGGQDAESLVEALGALGHAFEELGRAMEAGSTGQASPAAYKPAPIGIRIMDVTPDIARAVGNPELRGAGIVEVVPSSLAERAGVLAGDIITEVNGRHVETASEALGMLRNRSADAPLELVVFRGGRLHLLRVGAK